MALLAAASVTLSGVLALEPGGDRVAICSLARQHRRCTLLVCGARHVEWNVGPRGGARSAARTAVVAEKLSGSRSKRASGKWSPTRPTRASGFSATSKAASTSSETLRPSL